MYRDDGYGWPKDKKAQVSEAENVKYQNIKYLQHSEKAKFILDRQEWVGGIGWAAEISEIDHQ